MCLTLESSSYSLIYILCFKQLVTENEINIITLFLQLLIVKNSFTN